MGTVDGCTVFASLAALAGAVAGYFVRFVLAKRSAKRKEDWDQLRDLNKHVNELAEQAISFYCTQFVDANGKRAKAIQIQQTIRQVAQKVQFLARSLENHSLDGYLKRLRQSITQTDFDADVSRPLLELSDQKIVAIDQACSALVGAADLAYTRSHRAANF